MCEIFPEVEKCCFVFPLHLGILFISVLSIMSGAVTITVLEKSSEASFTNLKNVSTITSPGKAYAGLPTMIPVGIIGISAIFMLTGLILFFAALTAQEGFVQIFVWVTFLAICIGYIVIGLIGLECVMQDSCFLEGLDWLSAAAVLLLIGIYLGVWIYFICVANSYVLNN